MCRGTNQVYDAADTSKFPEGKAIVAWCADAKTCNIGALGSDETAATAKVGSMDISYSGYGGGMIYLKLTLSDESIVASPSRFSFHNCCYRWQILVFAISLSQYATIWHHSSLLVTVNNQPGKEYITIAGVSDRALTLKAFAFEKGGAKVEYTWGKTTLWTPFHAYHISMPVSDNFFHFLRWRVLFSFVL